MQNVMKNKFTKQKELFLHKKKKKKKTRKTRPLVSMRGKSSLSLKYRREAYPIR